LAQVLATADMQYYYCAGIEREKSDAAICNKVAHFATLVAGGGRRRYSISLRVRGGAPPEIASSPAAAAPWQQLTMIDEEHSPLHDCSLIPLFLLSSRSKIQRATLFFLALQNQLSTRPTQRAIFKFH
jgi:hypothetical protein